MNSAEAILVIDDSLTIRRLFELTFPPERLLLAGSGAEGLALACRHRPAAVFLDYVLPDRTGSSVCSALSDDARTAAIPVIVMSAKVDQIRHEFGDLPQVRRFLPKPFGQADLRGVLTALRQQGPELDRGLLETVAKAVFRSMRHDLQRVRDIIATADDSQVAIILARHLLSPEHVADMVRVVREQLPEATSDSGQRLAVDLDLIDLWRCLRLLQETGGSGLLTVRGEREHRFWIHAGRPAAALDDEPAPGLPTAAGDAQSRRAANRSACQNGLVACLSTSGARRLQFDDRQRPPAAVLAAAAELPLAQVELARLRLVDDWTQVEQAVTGLDMVPRRGDCFSARIAELELTADERRLLSLIDGRRDVRRLIDASGLSTFDVYHICFRLLACAVIQVQSVEVSTDQFRARRRVRIALISDDDGFWAQQVRQACVAAGWSCSVRSGAGLLADPEAASAEKVDLLLVVQAEQRPELQARLQALGAHLLYSTLPRVALVAPAYPEDSLPAYDHVLTMPVHARQLLQCVAHPLPEGASK